VDEVNKMMGKNIELMGYLLTQFEKTKMGKEVQEFFRSQPNTPVFPVPIRKCAKCNEAPKEQMSLFEYAPNSTAADDYMRLAEQITGKGTRNKKWTPEAWYKKASEAYLSFINEQEQ
jgi:cellulose biosynthesis protein BcsQ